jgi:hypothetical protein
MLFFSLIANAERRRCYTKETVLFYNPQPQLFEYFHVSKVVKLITMAYIHINEGYSP